MALLHSSVKLEWQPWKVRITMFYHFSLCPILCFPVFHTSLLSTHCRRRQTLVKTVLSLQGASVATKTCSDDVKSASQITRWRITQPGHSWLRDWAHETCISRLRSSTSSFLFLQSSLSCKLAFGNLWPKCYLLKHKKELV